MTYLTILSLFACIFSFFAVGLSLYACILSKSLEKSTHTVQMVPVDKEFSNLKDMNSINEEQQDENDDFFRMV
tara:strand:+ start:182 stop:400 length:219 start_codon:yes stop_codon:yes gene_type:complete